MAKRVLLTLGVAVLVISGLGFAKYRQIQGAMKGSHFEPPPEAITSVVAKPVRWPATNTLVGTAVAVHGVTVSADLPGKIDRSFSSPALRSSKATSWYSSILARSGLNSQMPK